MRRVALTGQQVRVLIGAYGMFWERDAVAWNPGSGSAAWRLLGRRGVNRPGLRMVDVRRARGVYVLFDHHGAYYAGLARGAGGMGERLKQHLSDMHAGKWQRFCWFAFDTVGDSAEADGLHPVLLRDQPVPTADEEVIRELEALLITILGTRGQNKMKFQAAEEWTQVPWWDQEAWLAKVQVR